jgi:CheY-like chemotaxis protein
VLAVRPLEGVRILLVEDDDETREITRLALEARGARLVCAQSATEGLAAIEKETPDVVLSDIAMPGTDGLAFLKRVRALPRTRGGRIPAVAITAFGTRQARVSSREAGFHYHLTKPYDVEKLTAIVSGLVRLTRS